MSNSTASQKKIITSWAMFDWANSAYNLVITSTIFPIYYSAITTIKNADGSIKSDVVNFLGISFHSGALYNYIISFAYLVIVLLSPILSSIADVKGNKKQYMKFFTYLGSLACISLYFFDSQHIAIGVFGCMLAAVGYCGGLVFYNAFLPEIAPKEQHDAVSAKGFSYGYVGSVILQLICFYLVLGKPFGLSEGHASTLSFVLVGLWWLGFAQITFKHLPNKPVQANQAHQPKTTGFAELKKVWHQLKSLQTIKKFLVGFFFYSMGVQTVMLAATLFGSQVLLLPVGSLIACILIIQVVAIAGAQLMSALSAKYGNIPVLLCTVFIWILVCIAAYFTTTDKQFYAIAAVVGLIMGGIQSLSRSTYSKLMPQTNDTASFFSFYDVTEKLAIVLGMFMFGTIQQITGDMRQSILALIVFFLLGFAMLFTILKNKLR